MKFEVSYGLEYKFEPKQEGHGQCLSKYGNDNIHIKNIKKSNSKSC